MYGGNLSKEARMVQRVVEVISSDLFWKWLERAIVLIVLPWSIWVTNEIMVTREARTNNKYVTRDDMADMKEAREAKLNELSKEIDRRMDSLERTQAIIVTKLDILKAEITK